TPVAWARRGLGAGQPDPAAAREVRAQRSGGTPTSQKFNNSISADFFLRRFVLNYFTIQNFEVVCARESEQFLATLYYNLRMIIAYSPHGFC
ncbi:MAG: hypothetical protein NZM35_10850, partial [Chitinophagales bacterium]|nr:hypothetical protein [Chitinophagales bacterium]